MKKYKVSESLKDSVANVLTRRAIDYIMVKLLSLRSMILTQ